MVKLLAYLQGLWRYAMFMLFVSEKWEERGGWNDFAGIFASASEAKAHEEKTREYYSRHIGQIVEVATMRVVSELDIYKSGKEWQHRWTDS